MVKLLKTKQCVSTGLAALALFSVLLFLQSCRHPFELPNPPEGQSHRPLPPPPIESGKRDYHWTVDTIIHPGSMQTIMTRMWGDSANDIYIVGHNDQGTIGCMYHYNGKQWESVKLYVTEGGLIDAGIDLASIYGFNAHNIYAVGDKEVDNPHPPPNFLDSSIIIHYDGVAWREVPIKRLGTTLWDIWGADENDIWACGEHGTIYHFINSTWTSYPWTLDINFGHIRGFSENDIYMGGERNLSLGDTIGPFMYYLCHWDGVTWTVSDSSSEMEHPMKFGTCLLAVKHHTLISSTYGVYQSTDGKSWEQILPSDVYLAVGGSSIKNIFAAGYYFEIHHWNGTDWVHIPSLVHGYGEYEDIWSDNKETFIIGNNGYTTYVMHGK